MAETENSRPTNSIVQKIRKHWLRILIGLLLLAWGIYLQSPSRFKADMSGQQASPPAPQTTR